MAKKIGYIDDFNTWMEEFSFSIPIKVRFSETDLYGHVNNVSAFIYFEEARIDFMKSRGLLNDDGMRKDEGTVVADLQCDFLREIYFGDKVELFVKTAHVGNTSFDLHYMLMKNDKEVALTGRSRMVYFSPSKGKSLELSEEQKRQLLA